MPELMLTPRAFRDLRHGTHRGQALVLMVLFLLVLIGIAGLAADGGHVYLTKRDVQNATDSSALAAGQKLAAESTPATPSTMSSTGSGASSAPIKAANAFAANNGFATALSTACDSLNTANPSGFQAVWVDSGSCTSPGAATVVVTVNIPPMTSPDGIASPCAPTNYSCMQVIIKTRVNNYLMGVFGIPTTTITASAVVEASSGTQGNVPPSSSDLYLYQPHSGFDATQSPAHSQLACSTSCPTYWTMANSQPTFVGINSSTSEAPALQSNGDMVIQGKTTFCDPTGGRKCQQGQDIGAEGWAIQSSTGSQFYCQNLNNVNPGGCVTTQATSHLDQLWGTKVSYAAETWTPTIAATGSCVGGDLVLNGDAVTSHYSSSSSCYPGTGQPYTIMPGEYHSIVINHGAYEFSSGVYEITGTAPVNTSGPTTGCSGSHAYTANGIDHCNEQPNNDVDLCNDNGQNAVACSTLTAGVWIGHGGGYSYPLSTGTSNNCSTGSGDNDGGGGDQTQVTGAGVTFLLDSHSGGFVSTNEVSLINLQAPPSSTQSSPILIDEQNNSMIHLDAGNPPGGNSYSQLNGIIYQPASVTGGGVELDSSLAHNQGGALLGQVLAYTFTTWGQGTAVDFTGGWGSATNPPISTSGHNENQIIGSPSPSLATASSSYPAGYETFTLNYTDEWSMDAYDAYVRINGSNAIFFSQNEWTEPYSNLTLPPTNNVNPNDNAPNWPAPTTTPPTTTPTYPSSAGTYTFPAGATSGYTVSLDAKTGKLDDFSETLGTGSTTSYFQVSGAWTWGHQKDMGTNPQSGAYNAVINYTFPAPAGSTVSISVFMTDGDHCGDYASSSYTLANPVVGGSQPGSVELLQ